MDFPFADQDKLLQERTVQVGEVVLVVVFVVVVVVVVGRVFFDRE